MKKYKILISFFLVISFTLHSQSVEQLERLQEIKNEKEASFSKKKQEAIEKAQEMGLPVKQDFPYGGSMELMYFIGNQPFYYITENWIAARTISTNQIHPNGITGYELDGSTEQLAIWDGGAVRVTHQEFDGRVVVNDGASALSDHATHVAGTMIAKGQEITAKGMSYQANLLAYDWGNDDSEMANAAATGLYVSNHSYGTITGWNYNSNSGQWNWYGNPAISNTEDYLFGFYNYNAEGWDNIANNAPYYMIVKSTGNDRNDGLPGQIHDMDGGVDGYDCISHTAVAKNILTIGAVHPILHGYSSTIDVVMTDFSSWGPTDDGRIKPDIVSDGYKLTSPIATSDDSYGVKSGTSMAAPGVSGSIGLLLQHQRNNFGDVALRSSTMKALLIHAADEAGTNPGPDYKFGWGLANFQKAAELIESSSIHCIDISEYDLHQDEVITIPVVKDPNKDLKITICWNDPAGTPPPPSLNPPTKMLVNDLDVRVTGGSTTYFPWVLDKTNPGNAATTGDNQVDNVEQIIVNSTYNGIYTIAISHKGTLQNISQIVSVIISGYEDIFSTNNVDYQNIYDDRSYWAHENLSSTGTTINAGANVNYIAGKSIKLNNYFSAKNGAIFRGFIDKSLSCSTEAFIPKNSSISSRFIYERNILPKSENNNFEEISESEDNLFDANGFGINPNPNNGNFTVSSNNSSNKIINIKLFNSLGDIVYVNSNISQSEIKLNINEVVPGLYIIQTTLNDNKTYVNKVLIK